MQVQIIAENIKEGGNRIKKRFVVALVFTALKNACHLLHSKILTNMADHNFVVVVLNA
jgi:hypothetical protein